MTLDEVARRPQHLLPTGDLAGQCVGHPVDEGELVGEVRDHCGDVRQSAEPEERGTALEVDEDEVQFLRRVGGGQPEDECAQQLALARSGGADAEPVRAAAALRRLLEVEGDRAAALVESDRDPQPVGIRAGPAVPHRGDPGRAGREGEERWQPGRGRRGRVTRRRPVRPAVTRQPPRERRGLGDGEAVGAPDHGGRLVTSAAQQQLRLDQQPHHRRCRPPGPGRPDPQHGDACDARPRTGPLGNVVDHYQQVRLADARTGCAACELGEPPVPHVACVGRDHPQRACRVLPARVPRVRQPLHPLPLVGERGLRHHGEEGVGGRVPERVLGDDGAGQRAHAVQAGAARRFEPHRAARPQRQGDRQVRDDRMGQQEAAQRERGDRFEAVDRPGLRGHQPRGEALGTAADAHVGEVGIRGLALPHPAGPTTSGQAAASGCAHSSAARCSAAMPRTRPRSTDRYRR